MSSIFTVFMTLLSGTRSTSAEQRKASKRESRGTLTEHPTDRPGPVIRISPPRIEEKKFPTIQVVKSVPADAAKYEEGAEIRRLLQQGVPLFNREAVQPTTRARLLMDEVYLPIEDAQ